MTTGERIKEIRRANNLSQEDLGFMLGVSRQAISKWESDQSLPELEKLVVLCKKYNLSIDYILGIDDKSNEEKVNGEDTSKEDKSDSTSDKFSGILIAYQKDNKKRENLFKKILIGSGCLLLIFAIFLGTLFGRISSLNFSLENMTRTVSSLRNNFSGEIASLKETIESLLQNQNSLLTSSEINVESVNIVEGTATFSVTLVPKALEKDMDVYIILSSSGEKTRFRLDQDEEVFSTKITVNLTDLMEFTCTIGRGEEAKTQIVDIFSGLESGSYFYLNFRGGRYSSKKTDEGITLSQAKFDFFLEGEHLVKEGFNITAGSMTAKMLVGGNFVSYGKVEKINTSSPFETYQVVFQKETKIRWEDEVDIVVTITDSLGRNRDYHAYNIMEDLKNLARE